MDEKPHSSTVFMRLSPSKCEHLKPLSVYSKMIASDQKANLDHPRKFLNSFMDFKFEVSNNFAGKRKLDQYNQDDGYESATKKSFNPKAFSPDLGCFMDDCSPAVRLDLAPSCAIPASLDKSHSQRSEIKIHSDPVDWGSSSEPGASKETETQSFKCETVVLNLAPAFDCDIDEILCLNPVAAAGVFSKNEDSGRRSSILQSKIVIPVASNGQVDEGQEDPKKEMHIRDEEADKGYFSMSYIKEFNMGKSPFQSGCPQLSTAASSPLTRLAEGEFPQDECHPLRPTEQDTVSGQHKLDSNMCRIVSGPPLESANADTENLDGDVEELWNIGPPMFESSICHGVTVKLNYGGEQRRQVTEEVDGNVVQSINATHGGEKSTLDSSYETSLPLQVQVKSVVTIPNQKTTTTSKPGASSLSEQNAEPARLNSDKRVSQSEKCVRSGRSRRLVMFDRQEWVHRKKNYVDAVTRHIKEKPGMAQDVMSELLNLMTHVAEQTPGTSHHGQWQHPSDLTHRNYQRRFGNLKPNISLDEWQAKSCEKFKRFAKVSKVFERSSYP